MRLRHLLATTAASALVLGAVSSPAHANTPAPDGPAGTLTAWGYDNSVNAITGPGAFTESVKSVVASRRLTGAITAEGTVRVWGDEGDTAADVPAGLTGVTALALTPGAGAALRTDGSVYAWGDYRIAQVPPGLQAKAIAVRYSVGYAVTNTGTLISWADNNDPYLMAPPGVDNAVDVSASETNAMALDADGSVYSWGGGDPAIDSTPDFGGKKVTQIAAGFSYNAVLFDDGTIGVWGSSDWLPPDQPNFDGATPETTVVRIAAGRAQMAAVTADGVFHTWGAFPEINDIPATLAGLPVTSFAVGGNFAVVAATPFVGVTKPTITGTPQVGQTLTATPAAFSLTPDEATGQWYADASPIAGKTGTVLVVEAAEVGKQISYRTTATRNGRTVTSASAATSAVAAAPAPAPDASTAPVTVTKVTSVISAKLKVTGKTTKMAKKVQLTFTAKAAPGVSPAGNVTIVIKGATKKITRTVKVGAGGKVTLTLRNVKRGTYTVKVVYGGNTNVASSVRSVKFKV